MNSIGAWGGAIVIAAAMVIHPQESRADGFTGKSFMGWTAAQQDSYIQTSITMAAVVATQTKPAVADCIDAWYRPDTNVKDKRNEEVRVLITQYPDYHPSGVIFAALRKACGDFK